MTASPDVFVTLEPSNHMGRVIRAAKERGLYVIAFHHYPLSTLPPYADDFAQLDEAHRVESWDDHEALLVRITAACAGRRLVGTYSALEFTLELDAKLRQQVGLPHNPPASIQTVLNKHEVRRILSSAGLSSVRFWSRPEVDRWTEWPEGLSAFFKPARGGGSSLVRRCRSFDDLVSAWKMWASKEDISAFAPFKAYVERDNQYILEEEIVGELMSLEAVVERGVYRPIGFTGRRLLRRDRSIEVGTSFPITLARGEEISERIARIHEALGIQHGPTHTEFMLLENGGMELVELNCRFIGADNLLSMNLVFDTRMEHVLLDLACGREVDPRAFARADGVAQLHYLLPPLAVTTFESIDFGKPLPFERVMKRTGDAIASHRTQLDYLAGFIVRGPDVSRSDAELRETLTAIRVNGQDLFQDDNNVCT